MEVQQRLFFETLTDALRGTVDALGGPKVVSAQMFPQLGADEARRRLLDCLNPDRPHRLDPDQLLHLLSLARAKGVDIGIAFILDALGYAAPVPIDPQVQEAECARLLDATLDRVDDLLNRAARLRIRGIPQSVRR